MQNTVIKGTGNSRSIKSPLTIPVLWEEARAQLISAGWPIDLGHLNPAGVDQMGMDLVKANMLSDETETALWGDADDRTPDQALAQLRTLITAAQNAANKAQTTADAGLKFESGSYNGAGGTGIKTIAFTKINPQIVILGGYGTCLFYRPDSNAIGNMGGSVTSCEWGTKSITVSGMYVNNKSTKYTYLAL